MKKFIGIDLHSNQFTVCILHEDGRTKIKKSYGLTKAEIDLFVETHLDKETWVMVEASTNTFKFCGIIAEYCIKVMVANTHKMKLISMVKKKTDKVDAEKLAMYLKMQVLSGEELIKPVYIPEEDIQDLRSLFTTYRQTLKQKGQVKNRIHGLLKQDLKPFTKKYIFGKKSTKHIMMLSMREVLRFQLETLFKKLKYLENELEEIEKQIKILGANYYEEIDILTSMKGMSVKTAIAIISDIAIVDRFPNAKHFTSYLRSAPGVDSSNDNTRNLKTNKFARKVSITFLTQALNHFRDADPRKKSWSERINLYKTKKGISRMALCRKTFTEIYQMLKTKSYHFLRDIENHKKKMEEYDDFLVDNRVSYRKIA